MSGAVDHEQFLAMLAERLPSLADTFDEFTRSTVFLSMGAFARATQAAISAEDAATVRAHFTFLDDVYRRATPELKNAVHVSYLEQISFDGRHGKRIKARETLSPQLQKALRDLEDYLAKLFEKK